LKNETTNQTDIIPSSFSGKKVKSVTGLDVEEQSNSVLNHRKEEI